MKQRHKHKCGCILEKVSENKWELTKYCNSHHPNYQKRADKLMHRQEKYRKRQKYLKHENH